MSLLPLYVNDGKPALELSGTQVAAVRDFNEKVDSGEYRLVANPCLCGGMADNGDWLISEKDRYGIPIRIVLCQHCGLVRSDPNLDQQSTAKFYDSEYRRIYSGQSHASAEIFEEQKKRGLLLLDILGGHVNLAMIKKVFEVGCGAGGILYSFREAGKEVGGCDYGQEYLRYGREKGLTLYCGDIDSTGIAKESRDLLILSHVLEHFPAPAREISSLLDYLKPGGYLLLEVPGVMNIFRVYFRPIMYFQNAHVFNYYRKALFLFLESLGLEIINGNEHARFLCRKPINPRQISTNPSWRKKLGGQAMKVLSSLIVLRYFWWLNPYWLLSVMRRKKSGQ
ncbi:class I SAM-dependent methyltransferase [Desulforhopalus singaporensis]|uniref:Methyltransferase domain-containing protein n=1 Tax=Desulforhopalus singaporensis TaxID=91360 RepID=A0A1H0QQG4_9BACT|nr:class I SAM-dependent methyltransferase [Desulforhopalus singaporensis]SDP19584.1 Methyltransferase domain-containing protein [Desulforhopalus singaporensis]